MKQDDLLKEAIADAKAVRETAMANARQALEEAFAPKLQSMLNATLQNEIEGEDDFGDEGGEAEFGAETDGKNEFAADTSAEEEFNEGEPESFSISGEVTLTPNEEGEEAGKGDFEGEEFGAEGEEPEELDEFSLESIVRELEEEAALEESADYLTTSNTTGADKAEHNAVKGVEKAGSQFAKKKTGLGFTAVKEEKIASPSMASGVEKAGKFPAKSGQKFTAVKEETEEEEVNLDELIKELKNEYESANNASASEVELNEVKQSLNEHRNVIVFLRKRLNEVNLLNAKLLFTNKLFKNHSMNESQKLRVIETLDRAITLKECKLIYSTLEEAFTGMKQVIGKSASARKIVESMASRPMGSTKPSAQTIEKSIINEGTELAKRFQKLAGIKK